MNKHQLILKFIDENYDLILAKKFPKSLFKERKRDFFTQAYRGHGYGVISNKEIAGEALRHFIKIGKISSEADLEEYLSISFFAKYVRNPTPHYEFLQMQTRKSPVIDVSDIGSKEFAERIHEEVYEQVRNERIKEIEEDIQDKREELESLPSVIDLEEPSEPKVVQRVVHEEEKYTPWWKRINLLADPFPTTEGIQDFEQEAYNRIVYKTGLFKRYLHYVNEEQDELFKNTIFFGEFGSGKTTLFQYFLRELWSSEITAIYLTIFTESNIHTMTVRFRQELIRALNTIFKGSIDSRIGSAAYENLDTQIIDMLRSHLKSGDSRGVVIFIDDLHKNVAEADVSLEFLSYLQIFTAKLNRELRGTRIAFYVAGLPTWKGQIIAEPRYSGSIQRREDIPEISAEDAYQMLNLRLKSFYPNPKLKREIRLEFVQQVFNYLVEHELPVTFRSFISRAVDEFQKGNFEILTADPFDISADTLNAIKQSFDSDPSLGPRFDNLLSNISQLENRRKILRIIVRLFQQDVVRDTDAFVQDNAFFFRELEKEKLILRGRLKKRKTGWKLCKELLDKNDEIMQIHSLSLEDYLLLLYGSSKRKPISTSDEIELIEKLIELSEKNIQKDFLNRTKEIHTKILLVQAGKEELEPTKLRELCMDSLETISRFFFTLIDDIILDVQPIKRWKRYWFYPSEIDQFLKSLWRTEDSTERIWYTLMNYRQTFEVLSNFILGQMERGNSFPVSSRNLTKKDNLKLDDICRGWMNHEYQESANVLRWLVSKKLSTLLFNTFKLLFGNQKERMKHIPISLRDKISSIKDESEVDSVSVTDVNEFSDLDLAQITEIMTAKGGIISGENWRNIFSVVFSPLKEDDFISSSNQLVRLCSLKGWSADDIDNLRILVWDYTDMLRRCNSIYLDIIKEHIKLKDASEHPVQAFFSFGSEERGGIVPIHIDCELALSLVERIPDRYIALDDPQFIQVTLGCGYREFMAFLGLSMQHDIDKMCNFQRKITMNRIMPPEVLLKRTSLESFRSIYIIHSIEYTEEARNVRNSLEAEGFVVRTSNSRKMSKRKYEDLIDEWMGIADGAIIILSNNFPDSQPEIIEIEEAIKKNRRSDSFFILTIKADGSEVNEDYARFERFEIDDDDASYLNPLIERIRRRTRIDGTQFDDYWYVPARVVQEYVGSQKEETHIEVKAKIDIDSDDGKAELIRDMVAMANRCLLDRKRGLILVGPRSKDGFGQTEFPDDNIYQTTVNGRLESVIDFLFKTVKYEDTTYGVFIIQPSDTKPVLTKKFVGRDGNIRIPPGSCWLRQGTKKEMLTAGQKVDLAQKIQQAAQNEIGYDG